MTEAFSENSTKLHALNCLTATYRHVYNSEHNVEKTSIQSDENV